jgi:phage protein D
MSAERKDIYILLRLRSETISHHFSLIFFATPKSSAAATMPPTGGVHSTDTKPRSPQSQVKVRRGMNWPGITQEQVRYSSRHLVSWNQKGNLHDTNEAKRDLESLPSSHTAACAGREALAADRNFEGSKTFS